MGVDIFVAALASGEASIFRVNQQDPNSNPFVDPDGYKVYLEDRARTFQEATKVYSK